MENYLTKRNLIIAAAVIVIIIGILVWFGLKNSSTTGGGRFLGVFPSAPGNAPGVGAPSAPSQPAVGGELGAENLPLSSEAAKSLPVGTLIRLSPDNISSLVAIGTTSARYHKNIPENLGHLFERRADGSDEEKRIANFTIPQVFRVVWAPDGKRAVVFYNLDSEVRKLLVDYSTSTPRTNFLPDTVSDVAFSPDSKSFAFINDLGDSQNIFIANANFTNQRKIFNNDIPGFEISWISRNTLALKTKSSYAVRGFLYALNINSGALMKIADGLGLDAVWNSDGSGALYSTVSPNGNMLNLKFVDAKTGAVKDVGAKTIAEKCAFLKTLKNIAYCGVPKNPPSGLPDAWWQGKISFADDFALVDASAGQSSIFIPTPLDITNPQPVANDSYLLFRDKSSGNLWSLKLKP